eukprot:5865517-Amphidinium_carterae.1
MVPPTLVGAVVQSKSASFVSPAVVAEDMLLLRRVTRTRSFPPILKDFVTTKMERMRFSVRWLVSIPIHTHCFKGRLA